MDKYFQVHHTLDGTADLAHSQTFHCVQCIKLGMDDDRSCFVVMWLSKYHWDLNFLRCISSGKFGSASLQRIQTFSHTKNMKMFGRFFTQTTMYSLTIGVYLPNWYIFICTWINYFYFIWYIFNTSVILSITSSNVHNPPKLFVYDDDGPRPKFLCFKFNYFLFKEFLILT